MDFSTSAWDVQDLLYFRRVITVTVRALHTPMHLSTPQNAFSQHWRHYTRVSGAANTKLLQGSLVLTEPLTTLSHPCTPWLQHKVLWTATPDPRPPLVLAKLKAKLSLQRNKDPALTMLYSYIYTYIKSTTPIFYQPCTLFLSYKIIKYKSSVLSILSPWC